MLIEVLNDMPSDVLATVSPRSVNLARFLKLPMLYMLLLAGLQSGLSVVFMKLVGELVQAGQGLENPVMTCILLGLMALSAVSQTHSLNMAMKEYDQLEVMPIFQAMIMMMWMMGGMIVLDEMQYYSTQALCVIAASFLISCLGIKLLTMKVKRVRL